MIDDQCVTRGVGFYLPSGVCDHCDTKRADGNAVPGLKSGAELIAEERQQQITKEGWSHESDDDHVFGELADAAIVYADAAEALIKGDKDISGMRKYYMQAGLSKQWPWGVEYLKIDAEPIRNLTKAGALIAAEIDRLQRLKK